MGELERFNAIQRNYLNSNSASKLRETANDILASSARFPRRLPECTHYKSSSTTPPELTSASGQRLLGSRAPQVQHGFRARVDVMYFKQRTGALHAVCWLESSFSVFSHLFPYLQHD